MQSTACVQKIFALAVHEVPTAADIQAATQVLNRYFASKKDKQGDHFASKQAALRELGKSHGGAGQNLLFCALAPMANHANRLAMADGLASRVGQMASAQKWGQIRSELAMLEHVLPHAQLSSLRTALDQRLNNRLQDSYETFGGVFEVIYAATGSTPLAPNQKATAGLPYTALASALITAALTADLKDPACLGAIQKLSGQAAYPTLNTFIVDTAFSCAPSAVASMLNTNIAVRGNDLQRKADVWLRQGLSAVQTRSFDEAFARLQACRALHEKHPPETNGEVTPIAPMPTSGQVLDSLVNAMDSRLHKDIVGFYQGLASVASSADAPSTFAAALRANIRQDIADKDAMPIVASSIPVLCPNPGAVLAESFLEAAASADCALLIEALLDVGIGKPPAAVVVQERWPDNWLRQATLWRWDAASYTFMNGADVLVHHPLPDAILKARAYEKSQTPLTRVVSELARLSAENWEIVGASYNAGNRTLHMLVRTSQTPNRNYTHLVDLDLRRALATVEKRGGAVCGYAQNPNNVEATARGECEHILIVDNSRRAAHRIENVGGIGQVQGTVESMARDGWRLCGMATSGRWNAPISLVFSQPAPDVKVPATMGAATNRLALTATRRWLALGQWDRAAQALEKAHCNRPWNTHRASLIESLKGMQSTPWSAWQTLLALVVQNSGEDVDASAFGAELMAVLRRGITDACAKHDVSVLCAAMHATPIVDNSQREAFMRCLTLVAQGAMPAGEVVERNGDPASVALETAITSGHVEIASLLVALSVDPDASLPREDGKTARELAADTGHVAVCEALDGNSFAAREWARLGAGQKAAVIKGGKNAAIKSSAATPQLVERLTRMGLDPSVAGELRLYLRRQAPFGSTSIHATTHL